MFFLFHPANRKAALSKPDRGGEVVAELFCKEDMVSNLPGCYARTVLFCLYLSPSVERGRIVVP